MGDETEPIEVATETRERLLARKRAGESLDDVLTRLLDEADEREPTEHRPGDGPETPIPPSEKEDTCPVCDEPIGGFKWVGPVTFELDPCGHQVDEDLRKELTTRE